MLNIKNLKNQHNPHILNHELFKCVGKFNTIVPVTCLMEKKLLIQVAIRYLQLQIRYRPRCTVYIISLSSSSSSSEFTRECQSWLENWGYLGSLKYTTTGQGIVEQQWQNQIQDAFDGDFQVKCIPLASIQNVVQNSPENRFHLIVDGFNNWTSKEINQFISLASRNNQSCYFNNHLSFTILMESMGIYNDALNMDLILKLESSLSCRLMLLSEQKDYYIHHLEPTEFDLVCLSDDPDLNLKMESHVDIFRECILEYFLFDIQSKNSISSEITLVLCKTSLDVEFFQSRIQQMTNKFKFQTIDFVQIDSFLNSIRSPNLKYDSLIIVDCALPLDYLFVLPRINRYVWLTYTKRLDNSYRFLRKVKNILLDTVSSDILIQHSKVFSDVLCGVEHELNFYAVSSNYEKRHSFEIDFNHQIPKIAIEIFSIEIHLKNLETFPVRSFTVNLAIPFSSHKADLNNHQTRSIILEEEFSSEDSPFVIQLKRKCVLQIGLDKLKQLSDLQSLYLEFLSKPDSIPFLSQLGRVGSELAYWILPRANQDAHMETDTETISSMDWSKLRYNTDVEGRMNKNEFTDVFELTYSNEGNTETLLSPDEHFPILSRYFSVAIQWWEQVLRTVHLKHKLSSRKYQLDFSIDKLFQALYPTFVNPKFNYECLESLGDGFLKFVIGEYLFFKYQDHDEGKLTCQRSRLVCNEKLIKVAKEKLHLYKYIAREKNDGAKWEGSLFIQKCVSPRQSSCFGPKVLADVVESIIGAASLGCKEAAKRFIYILLDLDTSIIHQASCSELYEASVKSSSPLNSNTDIFKDCLSNTQDTIVSMIHQLKSLNHFHVQRLEFLGDSIIDYAILNSLYPTSDDVSYVNEMKRYFVCNQNLSVLTIKLINHFPDLKEGIKPLIDNNEYAVNIYHRYVNECFKEYTDHEPPKVLGDIMECAIGYLYLVLKSSSNPQGASSTPSTKNIPQYAISSTIDVIIQAALKMFGIKEKLTQLFNGKHKKDIDRPFNTSKSALRTLSEFFHKVSGHIEYKIFTCGSSQVCFCIYYDNQLVEPWIIGIGLGNSNNLAKSMSAKSALKNLKLSLNYDS